MKILVLSDTHRSIRNVMSLLSDMKDVDRIIHLGDLVRDAQDLESIYDKIPVEYVAGNCDFFEGDIPKEKIIQLHGKRIFMTHGHIYNVKRTYEDIVNQFSEKKVDVVLFGHTHVPYLHYIGEGILMNPGSINEPRDGGKPSYGILEIDEKGKVHATLNQLKKF